MSNIFHLTDFSTSDFSLVWQDLRCDVHKSYGDIVIEKYLYGNENVLRKKRIFDGLSGEFKSGELVAVMGPSGAGKSKLLECIAGRRKTGVQGFIGVAGNRNVKRSFVPQQDSFFSFLTVKETLRFASKMKDLSNHKRSKRETQVGAEVAGVSDTEVNIHEGCVASVMKQVMLEDYADIRIRNLSGGQVKRVSIAQELLSKPDILILDEPTSGLDSTCCFRIVDLLASLIRQQSSMTIIVSIHQPNSKVFNLFSRVFMLSSCGECVYNDSPSKLLQTLIRFNLEVPEYCHPADFVLEAAPESVQPMVAFYKANFEAERNNKKLRKIEDCVTQVKRKHFLQQIYVLTKRSATSIIRDPILFLCRLFFHLAAPLFFSAVFPGCGKGSGCPPKFNISTFDDLRTLKTQMNDDISALENNMSLLLFILCFFIFIGTCLNSIVIPLTIAALRKEVFNGWYSPLTFFVSFVIADFPFQFVNSVLCSSLFYILSEQPLQVYRIVSFTAILYIFGFTADTQGIISGVLFTHSINAAVFIGASMALPVLLLSGIFVRLESATEWVKIVSVLSYAKYAVNGVLVSLFGYNRCGSFTAESALLEKTEFRLLLTNEMNATNSSMQYSHEHITTASTSSNITNFLVPPSLSLIEYDGNGFAVSSVISMFKLKDDDFIVALLVLAGYAVLLRCIAYLLLKRKVNSPE